MLKPRALRSGDRLAIVAPASPFDRQRFEHGLAELRRLEFEPVFDEQVFDRHAYLAGAAAARAAAIREAWLDPSIAGVVAVRGGYGSAHVLPLLNADEARQARKAFLGYSDLTSFLVYQTVRCELVSFHGPMLASDFGRGRDGYDRDSLLRCLMQAEPLGELEPTGLETLHPGEAAGVLLGGTLSQLVGSPRNTVRVCTSGRIRAVYRRDRGEAVSARQDADPAAPQRAARARVRRRVR